MSVDVTKLKWKSEPCFAEKRDKEPCWCACIVTVEYDDSDGVQHMDDHVIAPYGLISKEDAAHIVACHNKILELKKLGVLNEDGSLGCHL